MKKKELETGPKASYGYGGKFGTERDRMDKVTAAEDLPGPAERRKELPALLAGSPRGGDGELAWLCSGTAAPSPGLQSCYNSSVLHKPPHNAPPAEGFPWLLPDLLQSSSVWCPLTCAWRIEDSEFSPPIKSSKFSPHLLHCRALWYLPQDKSLAHTFCSHIESVCVFLILHLPAVNALFFSAVRCLDCSKSDQVGVREGVHDGRVGNRPEGSSHAQAPSAGAR